ncbi:hypothetical protein ACVI1J_009089 [Bradyrhizobium diazoefficiens]
MRRVYGPNHGPFGSLSTVVFSQFKQGNGLAWHPARFRHTAAQPLHAREFVDVVLMLPMRPIRRPPAARIGASRPV